MASCHGNILPTILISALLAERGQAISTFQPNCTHPPNGINFVSFPNTRSSLSIFWSMTSVIVLCTWSILHLNVPAVHRTSTTWQKIGRKFLDARTKLKWTLFTIIVPEFLLGRAISDFQASRAFAGEGGRTTRMYLANMDYFVLEWEESDLWSDVRRAVDAVLATNDLSPSERINIKRLRTRFWALDAWQWKTVTEWNIAKLPDTPEWQLERLDGGGMIIKLLALIQVLYLMAQLIGRGVARIPSTQLEVSALAFATCSAVTYMCYLPHPQNVEALHYIQGDDWRRLDETGRSPKDLVKELGRVGPLYLWTRFRGESLFDPDVGPEPIPNDASHMGPTISQRIAPERHGRTYYMFNQVDVRYKEVERMLFGILGGGLVFGGLHLISVESQFPTSGEQTGWSLCCGFLMAIPFITYFGYPLFYKNAFLSMLFWSVITIGYTLSRLFITVESYRSLLFQPPGAYVNTWSSLFPHWG